MKVYFFPPSSPFNSYIDMITNVLGNNGVEIINKKYQSKSAKFLSSFLAIIKGTEIYHFNWIENKASFNSLKNRIICEGIFLWLRFIKFTGGKLVWTMHNKESHFSEREKDRTFYKEFLAKFIPMVDMVLVHASETKDFLIKDYNYPASQICFVPHGSYISDDLKEVKLLPRTPQFTVLAFGMVNRYKNIPLLIRAFRKANIPDAKLVICGKCSKEEAGLAEEIQSELDGCDNVVYDNRFIPDDEVHTIFEKSDIAVLPYDKGSMINSGAAIMAFSQSKPIIVSRFGFMKDIEDRDFVYCYDYDNETDHEEKLAKYFRQLNDKYQKDPMIFRQLGLKAHQYAVDELNWENICADIVEFYKKISKKVK
ncbi:glycosyltransferase [Clostridium sp. BJN0013]|uniref:glycosyltransferase n=1 Tax=Clostridium sp. BJN0013 TaxID=3236840 RepID=UPI0034C6680C